MSIANAGIFAVKKKNCGAQIAHRRCGGEQGIRTLEAVLATYTISNRAPSTSSDNSPYAFSQATLYIIIYCPEKIKYIFKVFDLNSNKIIFHKVFRCFIPLTHQIYSFSYYIKGTCPNVQKELKPWKTLIISLIPIFQDSIAQTVTTTAKKVTDLLLRCRKILFPQWHIYLSSSFLSLIHHRKALKREPSSPVWTNLSWVKEDAVYD